MRPDKLREMEMRTVNTHATYIAAIGIWFYSTRPMTQAEALAEWKRKAREAA